VATDTGEVQIMFAVFDTEEAAQSAEGQIEAMAQAGYLTLGDVALARMSEEGKVHANDFADEHKKGWGTGAVVGGVVGLIFPPSIIAGAVVGAGVGGIYHHFRDKGISNKDLTELGEQLSPGQTALIAVVQDQFVKKVEEGIENYSKLGQYMLNADSGALVSVS
jgi:uncharacterized membrane protein